MRDETPISDSQLRETFVAPVGHTERIGIELEYGLVDRSSGLSRRYEGAHGTRALLGAVATELNGELIVVEDRPAGVALADGAEFTLETGGALEYASPPDGSLAAGVGTARERISHAAAIAEHFGMALLSGGLIPFTAESQIPWNPKSRVRTMLDYFAALGEPGMYAAPVMGLTLSAQTSLDYLSEHDLVEKLGVSVRIAPVLAALFANSPIANGIETGVLSQRLQFWRRFDPSRCGIPGFQSDPHVTVSDLVDWAAGLPMIYREHDGRHVPAPAGPFRHLLTAGFGDGTFPTRHDWELHLSQAWPHVRVRGTLELRAPDGPPWHAVAAPAAMCVGLAYHAPARRAVLDLLGEVTAAELDRATDDAAVKGLFGFLGPWPLHDLARELVRLARAGLAERVRAGIEPPGVVGYLDAVDEVVETSETFADRALHRWHGEFGHDIAKYVEAYRVR
jgi:glutamate--cysteine ligase